MWFEDKIFMGHPQPLPSDIICCKNIMARKGHNFNRNLIYI